MKNSRFACGGLVSSLALVPVLAVGSLELSVPLVNAPVDRVALGLWEMSAPQKGEEVLVRQSFGEGADGAFLGGEGKYGPPYGVEIKNPVPVIAGSRCDIAFEGRVTDFANTYVVYIKVLDAAGANISDKMAVPAGWSYSPHTKAFYQLALTLDKVNAWQRKVLPFLVPEGTAAMRVSVCPWRGTGVFCRSVDVKMMNGLVRRLVSFDRQDAGTGGETVFRSSEDGLRLTIRPEPAAAGATEFTATVADESNPPRPRALCLQVNVRKPLEGWTWHRDWRMDARVEGTGAYRVEESVGGHPVTRYPFSAVSKDGAGFALGMPFDEVAYENRVVGTNGITSSVAVGLLARSAGGTSATFRWQLFPFKGSWGFRSAARAYYALQGDKMRQPKPEAKEGTWLWPIWPSKAPERTEDFGLTFWEAPATIGKHPSEIAAAHARGIEVYPYTEAWGMRQPLKTRDDGTLPSVEERMAELRSWASTNEPGKVWFDAPRHIAAQAALNSFPVKPDGGHPFIVDRWDHWTHWWRTNADPRLPRPNRASICWDYTVGIDLDRVDGVYLDSVSYGFSVNFCNVRPDHLAVMDEPLVYDVETARPCADGMQHQVAFVRWVAERLHAKNKRVFGNVFGIAHRFHASTIDIFGSEVGGWGRPNGEARFHEIRSDVEACEKRFYAYHRPVTDLLQEGFYEHLTPEFSATAMTNYLARQMFYAFYPGVSTIGGEEKIGYANWRRYFDTTRRCERDRELFKVAVPLIRRLNKAGWEPETLVRADKQTVLVERFGTLPGECLLTVRNASDASVDVKLMPEDNLKAWVLKTVWRGRADDLSDAVQKLDRGAWSVSLAPWETVVCEVKNTLTKE